jgi:hypothetical protein
MKKHTCKMGANITSIPFSREQDPFRSPTIAEPYYIQWIADRFDGKSATYRCKEIG